MKSRKGMAMEGLVAAAVSIVLIGVALGVGPYINQQLNVQFPTITVRNESITLTNNTYVTPACLPMVGLTTNPIQNDTLAGKILQSTNYSFDATLGVKAALAYPGATDALWNISYTCGNTPSRMAVVNSTLGMATLATWLPIIAVIIAAAVIIFLVMRAFGGQGGV